MPAATRITADAPAPRHARDVDAWLRSELPWTIAEEYPSVFGAGARARAVTLEEDCRVLAHAAYLDLHHLAREHDAPTKIRVVGSVVVSPERRGEGLGSELMRRVVDEFCASDAELLVLWSDRESFYARFGFAPWGVEFLACPAPARPTRTVRSARLEDCAWLAAVHERKARRVARTREDFARAVRIPRAQTWILEGADGPLAYACVGKGLDFENVAHDTGGADEDLLELLRALPIAFASLPREREALAEAIGQHVAHPLALALPHPGLGRAALERARAVSIEGLDSI